MTQDKPSNKSSAAEFQCLRCQRSDVARLTRPPLPGAAGQEIVTNICQPCWDEWQHMEVMVINELRLNFMDPEAQTTLTRQMRDFLQLPAEPAAST
jgi:Fe-S cluster biosynthesis and repair protein YggX